MAQPRTEKSTRVALRQAKEILAANDWRSVELSAIIEVLVRETRRRKRKKLDGRRTARS